MTKEAMKENSAQIPPHRVDFADGWTVWRDVCFRSAGFPVGLMEKLVSADAAGGVDKMLVAEAEWSAIKIEAFQYCIDRIKESSGDERKAWRKFEKRLKQGKIPDLPGKNIEFARILDSLSSKLETFVSVKEKAVDFFRESEIPTSKALQEIAGNPKFREAIIWQNRALLHNAIGPYLKTETDEPLAKLAKDFY
jgi:hypothetical protein